MDISPAHVLLGDIGATNARLALLSNGVIGPIHWFTIAECPRLTDALGAFFEHHCRHVPVAEALLAVAGPVAKDRCALTNCPWIVDGRELCAEFVFSKTRILNDFEAIARSLPQLTAADL